MTTTAPGRQRILAVARTLVLTKGFPATTLDEICEKADVTKGGFYYHFASKDQLALELVEHHFDQLSSALMEGAYRELDDPKDRLLGFLDRTAEVMQGPVLKDGCILGVLTLDMAETQEETRIALSQRFSDLEAFLEKDFQAALRESGVKDPTSTATGLARQFLMVLEGSIVLSKAHKNPEVLLEGLRFFKLSLEAVLNTNSTK